MVRRAQSLRSSYPPGERCRHLVCAASKRSERELGDPQGSRAKLRPSEFSTEGIATAQDVAAASARTNGAICCPIKSTPRSRQSYYARARQAFLLVVPSAS